MTHPIRYSFVVFTLCLLLAGCSGTKHLPKGEKLYTGAGIKLESAEKLNTRQKRAVKAVAENAVRPLPNRKILGFRPKLWMYTTAGENPRGKFQNWLKKHGEAPVFISSIKPEVTSSVIDAKLFNMGIFNSFTGFEIIEKQNTAKIIYTSHIHKPYTVNELIYSVADDSMSRIIVAGNKKSLIKQGDEYSLGNLRNERIRIDALLKDNGYFYFSPEYLLFKADTSVANHDVTFRLTVKDSITEAASTVYRIHRVYIDQDYSLDEENGIPKDTLMYEGMYFLGRDLEMKIRPKVISRSVYLRKNEIYSRQNHNITLNRLMTMGNFKFVSMKFSESDTTAAGFLDVSIFMTPMPEHTFRAEMELVSKSNNYSGPRLNTSFVNRNTFKGAELLNLSLAASFEAQFSRETQNLYSFSLNPQVELLFPSFIVPFRIKTNSLYVPKTRFSLSVTYSKRVDYFDMRTFLFQYGYRWRQDVRQEHELTPVNISYTKLTDKTAAFEELLATNPFLKKSYEEQFIAGGTYIYTFNEQVLALKKVQFFFQLTTEAAGNILSLSKIIGGEEISAEEPESVLGSVYSQYARMSLDGRSYYNFPDRNKLALRVYAGMAKPYGNSSVLPYTRQFFSGGPSSIRAFSINSVGPGTYNQNNDSIGYLQLGGDIKLEMNAEYRFGIYRFFKGAVFADAGNVWLLKSNPSTLGGSAFSFSDFASEIAVGAGIGLRIDVSFFILRFDLATPLRKPWLEENNRWVIDEINPGNSAWRRENLILNVAIGYPF